MNASGEFDTSTAIMVWVMVIGTLFVFFAAPIFALIFVLNSRQIWQAKKNLTALAGRLGFALMPEAQLSLIQRTWRRIFSLSTNQSMMGIYGQVHARSVRIFSYTVSTVGPRRYDVKWTEMAVSTSAASFSFSLRPKNIVWKLLGQLSNQEIKLNDEEFDRHWRVNSNQPETLKVVLLPELRSQINQYAARLGEFSLESDAIRYRVQGDFNNAALVARYEGMIGLLCDLAEAAEVAAKNYRPESVKKASPGGVIC